ncbi:MULTISPECIES: hypothetical protein [Paraburkholderia]|uniref:Uncharacterized protein n=2 Tax=Paraburkholderia TaxID=1822464 RepID=A0A7Y9WWI7_9BURK|nr:hypothetical protein [Paraburkholderia bryophila]NYH27763.1 hypothetical protein [Paraburkholderia bryophila]
MQIVNSTWGLLAVRARRGARSVAERVKALRHGSTPAPEADGGAAVRAGET